MGKLYVVGFGPGSKEGMTLRAVEVIGGADCVVGYTTYVELVKSIFPDKRCISTGMRAEEERVREAIKLALEGHKVALVCSGDAAVYGMAGLALELIGDSDEPQVEIVCGVTAALSGGALLGAPLGHDFACISLSDYLTDRDGIEKKVKMAYGAGFVLVLYNPSSKARPDGLKDAAGWLLEAGADGSLVCGVACRVGRERESIRLMKLSELADYEADMFTTVFIGSSQTRIIGNRMVTPRGYRTGDR